MFNNTPAFRYLNLNESDIRSTLDENLHKAYMLGRKKMARFVTSSFFNKETNTTEIEFQILQFLDQLYDTWILRKVRGLNAEVLSVFIISLVNFVKERQKSICISWCFGINDFC